jgi:hypothetical protein
MYSKNLVMFVVLSIGMLTALTAMTLTFATPVFASKKHCEDNGDNNCNSHHNTQKIKSKNECEIENKNKDHSHDNENINGLVCASQNANLRDSVLVNSSVFGDPFTT